MTGTTTSSTARTPAAPGTRRAPGPRRAAAGRHRQTNRWAVLVVLCASLMLVAMDSTVLHVAVPALSEDLRPGAVELLWIVDAYPLVAAALLILFGTLGDRVGRRRILLLGYGLFALASALAAFAPSATVLIGARALLGVGGAMIMPATLSIVRHVFPDRRERAVAVGAWSAVAAAGAAVGPLLGGFLLQHFWWGSVFVVNIPLMAVSLPVGRLLLPESTGDGEGPWDVFGAVVAALGILGVVLGIKRAGDAGVASPGAALPFLAGLGMLSLFARRQRRRKHPLVDMRLFARASFSTSVGCIVISMLALVGLALIAVQYLQLVLGLSPLDAGLRLLPLTVSAVGAGLLGARLLRRLGPRAMVSLGFGLTATGVLLLTAMGQHDRPTLLTCCFLILGFGIQTTLFAAYESMLSEAPCGQAGGAAAIGETSYQLGSGLGVAVLGSVMNSAYAPAVARATGVPPHLRRPAGRSLGEAYEVSRRLDRPEANALREAARSAFVHGLHVALLVSAGLLLLGVVAAQRLPRVFGGCGEEPADEPDGGVRRISGDGAEGADPDPGGGREARRILATVGHQSSPGGHRQ